MEFDTDAPYNEKELSEREFDILVSYSLSKDDKVYSTEYDDSGNLYDVYNDYDKSCMSLQDILSFAKEAAIHLMEIKDYKLGSKFHLNQIIKIVLVLASSIVILTLLIFISFRELISLFENRGKILNIIHSALYNLSDSGKHWYLINKVWYDTVNATSEVRYSTSENMTDYIETDNNVNVKYSIYATRL